MADGNPSGLGAFELPLRLRGQYFDAETGLHYNYFRDYDASIGRYAQSDPIGLFAGLNTYGYAGAKPLSLRDPLGLQPLDPDDPATHTPNTAPTNVPPTWVKPTPNAYNKLIKNWMAPPARVVTGACKVLKDSFYGPPVPTTVPTAPDLRGSGGTLIEGG